MRHKRHSIRAIDKNIFQKIENNTYWSAATEREMFKSYLKQSDEPRAPSKGRPYYDVAN